MSKNFALSLVIALMLVASSNLMAKDTTPAASTEKNLLLFFEIGDKSGISKEQTVFLYESLFSLLTKMNRYLFVFEAPTDKTSYSVSEKTELAQKINAQTWLLVKIQGQLKSKQQTLTVQVYDLVAAKLAIDKTIRKEDELSARAIERNYWNEVNTLLKAYYLPGNAQKGNTSETTGITDSNADQVIQKQITNIENGTTGELIVRALPGSKIYGLSQQPLVVGADSMVVANVLVPGTYALECRSPGFYTLNKDIYVDQKRTLLTLEQEPGARYALDFHTINFTFFGAAFAYYFLPNTAYAKAGVNSYLFGIFLNNEQFYSDNSTPENQIFESYPLLHLYLTGGYYFNQENSLFRFYGELSLFTRLFYSKGYGISIEPISPFGAQPALGMEVSPFVKCRFYVEWAPQFYLTGRFDLMLASYQKNSGDDDFKPFIPLPFMYMVIAPINFQLGVRWIL